MELRLRADSLLRPRLEDAGFEFLTHAAGATERILPHVEVKAWQERDWADRRAVRTSPQRTKLRITMAIEQPNHDSRSVTTRVRPPVCYRLLFWDFGDVP